MFDSVYNSASLSGIIKSSMTRSIKMELLIPYLLAITASGTRSVVNKKASAAGNGSFFNLIRSSSAFLIFAILAIISGFDMHPETLGYAVLYGLFVFTSCVFGLKALESGPLSITSSLVSFALVIPSVYGAVRYNEPISVLDIIGFVLIIAAILALKRKGKSNCVKLKRGWVFYLVATIISDGCHSTIKVIHQRSYPGMYLYEFM